MTNGEFVSGIMNDGKLLSKDTKIPRRHILAKGRSIADTYIAQRLDSLDITFEYDIISIIDCLELERVEGIKCGVVDLRLCKNVMKSKNKLPKTINGRVGAGVLTVTSLDGDYEFSQVSSKTFRNKMKSKYVRDRQSYYVLEDGYLILPNSEVEYIRVELLALSEDEVEDCGCNGDSGKKSEDNCRTVWDEKFICPDNIFTMVRDKTMQEIASIYLQIRADENPDLDENTRSNTIA